MNNDNPGCSNPDQDETALDHQCVLSQTPLSSSVGELEDDWEEDPPRRRPTASEDDPGIEQEPLDFEEINDRHLGLLGSLIEQAHPLASEYLTVAREVSPDAPGRDRIVSTGCRLVNAVNQLIATSRRLRED